MKRSLCVVSKCLFGCCCCSSCLPRRTPLGTQFIYVETRRPLASLRVDAGLYARDMLPLNQLGQDGQKKRKSW